MAAVRRALRGHPALVAYNPLNEPHPERAFGFEEPDEKFDRWRARAKGTPELNRFNRRVVEAIRGVDPATPILLDGAFYASPAGLSHLDPVEGRDVLYAFHFYEPWAYTTFRVNGGRYAYPDRMPARRPRWDAGVLKERLSPVVRWAREKGIPPSASRRSGSGARRQRKRSAARAPNARS